MSEDSENSAATTRATGRTPEPAKFAGREEAGRLLTLLLNACIFSEGAVVITIPPGGVPVAIEVAGALSTPLNVLVVEKVFVSLHAGKPGQPIGAVGAGGVCFLDSNRIREAGITKEEIESAVAFARNDQAHKQELYGLGCPRVEFLGRTIILVDDLVNTGATMRAAIDSLRQENPAKIVVATPVGSASACRRLGKLADLVVCPVQPSGGVAIESCYLHFPPITDADAYMMIQHNHLQFGRHQLPA